MARASPEMYFSEWKEETIMLTCAMMALSRSYASAGVRHSSRISRSSLLITRHSLTWRQGPRDPGVGKLTDQAVGSAPDALAAACRWPGRAGLLG